MSARLTALHEHYRKKRYNHRVVFGQPLRIVRRGWRSRYAVFAACLLYTSPSPRDKRQSRMPSSA